MQRGQGRRTTLQWKGAEIEMDTPVLKVVRDIW
jgi:hypothetical protein